MSGIPKPDPEAPVEHLCAMSRHGRAESRYLMRAVTNMEVPIARGRGPSAPRHAVWQFMWLVKMI
jgi:hypothetical protein